MKTFIVNKINDDGNAVHGIAVIDRVVLDNIRTMYGEGKVGGMHFKMADKKDFYFISRFCQYVGFVRYEADKGLSMQLTDFKGNLDNVLDEYLSLTIAGWDKADKDQYVKIVQEIIDDKDGELGSFHLFPLYFQV